MLVALVAAVAVVRAVVLGPLTIASDSMEPTLAAGEVVLVDRLGPRLAPPGPGDLVVFTDPVDGTRTLKRVVATGGQVVEIRDAVLHVDGVAVPEPYADLSRVDGTWLGQVRVPDDAVFVLGDHRDTSVDSRDYGPVARSALQGRVLLRLWPPGPVH